jgi:hypothetical protein
MIGRNASSLGLGRGAFIRYPGGSGLASIFSITRHEIPKRLQADRLLFPSASTNRRTLIHWSMSVYTSFGSVPGRSPFQKPSMTRRCHFGPPPGPRHALALWNGVHNDLESEALKLVDSVSRSDPGTEVSRRERVTEHGGCSKSNHLFGRIALAIVYEVIPCRLAEWGGHALIELLDRV